MKVIIFVTLLLLSSYSFAASCPSNLDEKNPIDQIIIKFTDVDGDGIKDKIELHLKGKNFYSPFKWELKVYSKGKVIYSRIKSNERIEPFFSDSSYIGGCTGYDDCKCQWFFEDLNILKVEKMSRNNDGVFDEKAPNSIYVIAKRYLRKEYKKNPKLVEKAIKDAVDRLLTGKAVAIVVSDEPEITTPPMVWMPEFSRFVPIYED